MKKKLVKDVKLEPRPESKPVDDNNVEALKSLSEKYENILEAQMKALYGRVVSFIAASQIPLVHANTVIDLIKADIIEQLHTGYFGEKK